MTKDGIKIQVSICWLDSFIKNNQAVFQTFKIHYLQKDQGSIVGAWVNLTDGSTNFF